MFIQKLSPEVRKSVLWKWCFLSFLGGQINAGGMLSAGRFVSHVTGFATLFGIEAGQGQWWAALGMITVPLAFLVGVMISGYFVEARILREERPRLDIVMSLVVVCLLICTFGSQWGWLQNFGQSMRFHEDYWLMALLCMASGLQNAAITSSSGKTVRVTHHTGTTTDLGIGLTRWMAGKANSETAKREWMMSRFRVGLILSFALGSAVSTVFYVRFKHLGFLLPALCSVYTVFEARRAIQLQSNTTLI